MATLSLVVVIFLAGLFYELEDKIHKLCCRQKANRCGDNVFFDDVEVGLLPLPPVYGTASSRAEARWITGSSEQ